MALTETQLQDQWRKAVDIIEQGRVFADGLAGASNEFEALTGVLKGEFTPDELALWARDYRSVLSVLTDSSRIHAALSPLIRDYGKVLQQISPPAIGSNYESITDLMNAIYEHFITKTLRVESRSVVLDTTPTNTGTGNGEIQPRIIHD